MEDPQRSLKKLQEEIYQLDVELLTAAKKSEDVEALLFREQTCSRDLIRRLKEAQIVEEEHQSLFQQQGERIICIELALQKKIKECKDLKTLNENLSIRLNISEEKSAKFATAKGIVTKKLQSVEYLYRDTSDELKHITSKKQDLEERVQQLTDHNQYLSNEVAQMQGIIDSLRHREINSPIFSPNRSAGENLGAAVVDLQLAEKIEEVHNLEQEKSILLLRLSDLEQQLATLQQRMDSQGTNLHDTSPVIKPGTVEFEAEMSEISNELPATEGQPDSSGLINSSVGHDDTFVLTSQTDIEMTSEPQNDSLVSEESMQPPPVPQNRPFHSTCSLKTWAGSHASIKSNSVAPSIQVRNKSFNLYKVCTSSSRPLLESMGCILKMEDEEGEEFSNKFLEDLRAGHGTVPDGLEIKSDTGLANLDGSDCLLPGEKRLKESLHSLQETWSTNSWQKLSKRSRECVLTPPSALWEQNSPAVKSRLTCPGLLRLLLKKRKKTTPRYNLSTTSIDEQQQQQQQHASGEEDDRNPEIEGVNIVNQVHEVSEHFNYRATEMTFTIEPPPNGTNPVEWTVEKFDNALEHLLNDIPGNDNVVINITNNSNLDKSINISNRRRDQVNSDVVLGELEKVMQSNQDFSTDNITIKVHHIVEQRGGTYNKGAHSLSESKEYFRLKRSIIIIKNQGNVCLPQSLIVAMARCVDSKEAEKISEAPKRLAAQARQLSGF